MLFIFFNITIIISIQMPWPYLYTHSSVQSMEKELFPFFYL